MFFGIEASKKILLEYKKADLIVANNVLAHVPDINDFVSGLTMMLSEDGIITIEFPHLMQLVKNCCSIQFIMNTIHIYLLVW